MRSLHSIAVVLALGPACTCGSSKAKLDGDDVVVASVNGSEITKYDVQRAIGDSLGAHAFARLDADARKKVLQSLVQSRAIAQARAQELTPDEAAALDKKVAAFREEVLVKQYLAKHASSGGVSPEMIEQYYRKNPERFGAKVSREYELVTATQELAGGQRAALIEVLGQAKQQSDWQAWVEQLKQAGQPVALRRGQADDQVLHPKLRKLLAQLELKQASALTFIDGQPYIARITGERKQAPRPLSEVGSEIRKTLAPVTLRDAVKDASEQVMKEAEVAYR